MIAKLWNEEIHGYVYFDKVRRIQVENTWAFTQVEDDKIELCQVRVIDGNFKIISSCIGHYDEDFGNTSYKCYVNSIDATTIHLVHIIKLEFEDGKHYNILTSSSSDDNYLMNNEGKTIQRL